jgi:ABC-type Fe3+ transport system permease subunit
MDMVSYDSTQIALYLSLVLAMAAAGLALVLATFGGAVARNRRARLDRHESRRTYYGRLTLHH